PHILQASFDRLREECARRGVRALVVYRPGIGHAHLDAPRRTEMLRLAAAAGLETIDPSLAVDSTEDQHALGFAPWDAPMNARAHALFAERLYDALAQRLGRSVGVVGADDRPSHAPGGD